MATKTKKAPRIEPLARFEDANNAALADVQGQLTVLRDAAVDVISDAPNITTFAPGIEEPPSVYDRIQMVASTPQGPLPMRLLEGAHEQLSDKLQIPWTYYERMLKEIPELLAENINRWNLHQPKRRLLRLLKPITPKDHEEAAGLGTKMSVRAILGDHYRPIDHGALLNQLIPTMAKVGARVSSWQLTEKRFYIKLVTPDEGLPAMVERLGIKLKSQEGVRYVDLGARTVLDEVIGFGAAIRNSETGHGSFTLDPMIEVRHCVNQLIVASQDRMRVIHLGGRLAEEEDTYQVDTKALDNAATFLKIRDRFSSIFTDNTRRETVGLIAERMGEPIPLPQEVPLFEFLGNISQTFQLTDSELNVLQEEVVQERHAFPQPLTPWTISQGLTATAKKITDPERQDEVRRLGWKVLSDPVTALLKAGKVEKAGKARRN